MKKCGNQTWHTGNRPNRTVLTHCSTGEKMGCSLASCCTCKCAYNTWLGIIWGTLTQVKRKQTRHKPFQCPAVLPALESEIGRPRQSAGSPQTFQCCSEDLRWPWQGGRREHTVTGTTEVWLSTTKTQMLSAAGRCFCNADLYSHHPRGVWSLSISHVVKSVLGWLRF